MKHNITEAFDDLFAHIALEDGECPSSELLDAHAIGTLPASLREPLRQHLKQCAACRDLFDRLTALEAHAADHGTMAPNFTVLDGGAGSTSEQTSRPVPAEAGKEQQSGGFAGKVIAMFRRRSTISEQPLDAAAATPPIVSEQWHLDDSVSSVLSPADGNSCYLRLESGDSKMQRLEYAFDGDPACSGQVELNLERGSYWAEISIPLPYALLRHRALTVKPTPQQ